MGLLTMLFYQELFDTHLTITTARAFHRVLAPRITYTEEVDMLTLSTDVYVYHRSSYIAEPVK